MFYSSPQARVLFIATGQGGERERGRQQGGERGRQQGGGSQGAERDGGSVQREAGEAPGERGAKRSEGRRGRARRRLEARGPPAPRPGRCAARQPPPRPAPLGPGAGRALSAVESSRAADSERSGPRAWNGRAGSRAPGASPDPSLRTSASARVPARPAPGWALGGVRLGTAGRLRVLLSWALGVLRLAFTRCHQPRAAFECLEAGAALAWGRVAGVKQRRPRPAGPGEAGRAEVCRRTSGRIGGHAWGVKETRT